jgi:hypothetical protein
MHCTFDVGWRVVCQATVSQCTTVASLQPMSRQLQVLPLLLVTRHRVPLNWPPLLLGRLSNPMGPEGCSGTPAHLTTRGTPDMRKLML